MNGQLRRKHKPTLRLPKQKLVVSKFFPQQQKKKQKQKQKQKRKHKTIYYLIQVVAALAIGKKSKMSENAETSSSLPLHFKAQLIASAILKLDITILYNPPRVILLNQDNTAEFIVETERVEAILTNCTSNCISDTPTSQST